MKKLKLDIQMFSSTNKTTNYELPQFVGSDKPTWLGDVNQAMADIDAGMHENATNISTMASDVASASATASQASQDVSALTSTVNTLSTNVTAVTTTANNAQQTATSALNTANTANGKADTNASAITSIQSDITSINSSITSIESDIETNSSYSTTESVVGTWIDGKPIYRKVLTTDHLANDGSINVPHGITNLGQLINCSFRWYDSEDGRWYNNVRYGSTTLYIEEGGVTPTSVVLTSKGTNWSTRTSNVAIIIEYTKSTD